MKQFSSLLSERLKLNKDTMPIQRNKYLIWASWGAYRVIEDNLKDKNDYEVIKYTNNNDINHIYIINNNFDIIKDKLRKFSQSTVFIWELPYNFNINEFEDWFTNPKRKWEDYYGYMDVAIKITKKYKLKLYIN